jgi:hypothetical protein
MSDKGQKGNPGMILKNETVDRCFDPNFSAMEKLKKENEELKAKLKTLEQRTIHARVESLLYTRLQECDIKSTPEILGQVASILANELFDYYELTDIKD